MKYIFLTCIILSIYSCTVNKHEKEGKSGNQHGQVVIIFCNPVTLNQTFKLKFGGELLAKGPDFTIHDGIEIKSFTPDTSKVNDTLCLNTDNKIVLKCKYKVLSNLYYLFQPGDSVLINYSDSTINVCISNRNASKFEANFDLEVRDELIPGQAYSPLDKYYSPFAFMSQIGKGYEKQKKIDTEKYFNNAIIYLEEEKHFLDSLKQHVLISQDGYNFYRKKNEYLKNKLLLNEGKLAKSEIDKFIHDYSDSLYFNETFFYRDLMHQIVYSRDVEGTENIDLGNSMVKNYKTGFDNIVNDSLLNGKLKQNSLKGMVFKIGQYFSKAELKQYLDKYVAMYSDTIFIASLKKQYLLNFPNEALQKDSLILIDIKGNKHTFAQVLNKHKGKVLYIDFWASWCSPCRQMFPYSHALQKELKNKGITFIYLSIDKNRQQWQQAVKDERMEDFPESYLVINPEVSEYFKELQIKSIPRYIIYDKDGILVYKDAPSPKSNELSKIIENLSLNRKNS